MQNVTKVGHEDAINVSVKKEGKNFRDVVPKVGLLNKNPLVGLI